MRFYFVLIEQLKMHTISNLHFHSTEISMLSCRFRADLQITTCQENTDLSCPFVLPLT